MFTGGEKFIMATITTNLTNGNDSFDGGADDDIIYGLNGNDLLTGGDGNDTLYGGAQNDTLTGGLGADTLVGGTGDDEYYVNSLSDTVTEFANQGNDTIYTNTTYALSANVETLVLQSGFDYIFAIGNNSNNTLIGNEGTNILDGLGGADYLAGGGGNDFYGIENVGDVVVEELNGGFDTVYTTVDYSLSANVENLIMLGNDSISVMGNEMANYMIGNDGDNIITAGLGSDTVYGGGGNDLLVGGPDSNGTGLDDNDFIYGGDGSDLIRGGAGHDSLFGQNGNDILFGGAGNDDLKGSVGNDTLLGGDGNDLLQGQAGPDIMIGGRGNDFLSGGSSSDRYYYTIGEGRDTINEFAVSEAAYNNYDALFLYKENDAATIESIQGAPMRIGTTDSGAFSQHEWTGHGITGVFVPNYYIVIGRDAGSANDIRIGFADAATRQVLNPTTDSILVRNQLTTLGALEQIELLDGQRISSVASYPNEVTIGVLIQQMSNYAAGAGIDMNNLQQIASNNVLMTMIANAFDL
jgi:Ca2+-binding RTX toxin-like protein